MTRVKLVGVKKGYLLVWGGIHIELSEDEWDTLVAQGMKIKEQKEKTS